MTVTEMAEAPIKATFAIEETAVAREVATLWPHLFGPGVFVPLKIGIDKALAKDASRRGSALTRAKIRLFVGWHVMRVPYHQVGDPGWAAAWHQEYSRNSENDHCVHRQN